jgi:hypothetical protein
MNYGLIKAAKPSIIQAGIHASQNPAEQLCPLVDTGNLLLVSARSLHRRAGELPFRFQENSKRKLVL